MTDSGFYPIMRLKDITLPPANQGYEVWYWQLEGPAFESPLEPLTARYWKKHHHSALVYGLAFPGKPERDHGDLLILVSQKWKYVQKNHHEVNFSIFHRALLFELILKIGFSHTEGIKELSLPVHDEIIKRLEYTFENFILPKRDDKGRYYRGFNQMEAYDIQRVDDQGRIRCPKCGKLVRLEDELVVAGGFQMDDQMVFMNAFCTFCGVPFGLRLEPQSGKVQRNGI